MWNTFGDLLVSVAIGRVKVDPLNELHIVQQRIERHEIRKADLPPRLASARDLRIQRIPFHPVLNYIEQPQQPLTATKLSLTSLVSR